MTMEERPFAVDISISIRDERNYQNRFELRETFTMAQSSFIQAMKILGEFDDLAKAQKARFE